jgi:hypothetical protein
MEYVLTAGHSTTGIGMRFEALGRWPGIGTCLGMNMDRGHAIRLRASHVKEASSERLVGTVAHELAHTEQWAEGKYLKFKGEDACERDVEKRLRAWGFDAGGTKFDRQELLWEKDQIIKYATDLKATVEGRRSLPSGNFVAEALSEVTRARNMMSRSIDRWNGRT